MSWRYGSTCLDAGRRVSSETDPTELEGDGTSAGRMVGKALYDGVLIDVAFAPFFANKILGHYSYLEDLPNLDATLYKSLCDLKRYEGDASDLCLDFTINDEFLGEVSHAMNAANSVPNLADARSKRQSCALNNVLTCHAI